MLRILQLALIFGTSCFALNVQAAEGEPVAIIRQADGSVSIETMWNLSATITSDVGDHSKASDGLERRGRAGVNLIRAAKPESGLPAKQSGFFTAYVTADTIIDQILDRLPSHANATWQVTSFAPPSANALNVVSIDNAVVVVADGVKVAQVVDAKLTAKAIEVVKDCDVLIFDGDSGQNEQIVAVAKDTKARVLILNEAGSVQSVQQLSHNTIAVTAPSGGTDTPMRIVTLASTAPEMPKEITDLLDRKEAACRESQKVFAALSTAQMNFKPSNGSHTPRWNTEHMMGRELQFFSQIFHAVDDSIPVMNLNPKQMPPDYRAKHADWTGNEEARQMERVAAFTRRYAYLLKDLPLDKKAPGSFWTPRKLLLQMIRHYSEHTANVQKKFNLPDWPSK